MFKIDVNIDILLNLLCYADFCSFLHKKALCKRTLNVVEALSNAGHGGRMRFYLSKADEAGHESDR